MWRLFDIKEKIHKQMDGLHEPHEHSGAIEVARDWRGLFSVSGVLLIITAVLWTIVTRTANVLYASGYPSDAASYLQLISQHQVLASVTWSLWIVSDFLLMAPAIALYIVLQRYNRTLALLGSLFAMFFNVYDVCVTELNSLTLVSLAHGYAGATTDAATYGYHGLPLQTMLSFATGTFGYLLWCVPMFKSIFRRGTAIFGAVVMVIALVGSAAPFFPSSLVLGLCQFVCVPACALWFVLVGLQLLRHARSIPAAADRSASVGTTAS
jgi:hypothetical protein